MSYVNFRQETPYCSDFSPRCEPPRVSSNNGNWRAPDSVVARDFSENIEQFQCSDSGFVTQQSLQKIANRELTGNPFNDQMTFLAREILGRPELNGMLDSINHGGSQDGLISKSDADRTVARYEQQEVPARREYPGKYGGAMQRQRLENQYCPQADWQQPSMSAPAQRPYANDTKEQLLNKIQARFSSFEDPNSPGMITDKSLSAVANGRSLEGRPVSQAEQDLANELLERGDVFNDLDRSGMGVSDGAISRNDLSQGSDKHRNMSDHDLIQGVKDNFRQFTAGANDDYISFNELKEAAGLTPSNRTFSPEAQKIALELLNRPGLLRDLDIGTNNQGGLGYEDTRFDMDNINHILNHGRASA